MPCALTATPVVGLAGSQLAGKTLRLSRSAVVAPPRAKAVITCASKTYTVKSGDYLLSISRTAGCSVDELKAVNADVLAGGTAIFPGQQLAVPGADSATFGGVKTWLGGGLVVLLVAAALLAKPKND